MVKKQDEQKAFTLIELLLVVGLVIISIGVTGDILLSLVRSYTKSQVINEIEQSANFVSQKMEKELRNAKSIDKIGNTTPPATDTTGNSIVFTDRNGDIIAYELNSSTDKFRRGICTSISSCSYVDLTPALTSVGAISVSCPGSCFTMVEAIPQVVSIKIQFQQAGSQSSNIFTGKIVIDNVIVIRNSY